MTRPAQDASARAKLRLQYRGPEARSIADEVEAELKTHGLEELGSIAPLPDGGRLGGASQLIIGLVVGAAGKAVLQAVVSVLETRLRKAVDLPRVRVSIVSPAGEPVESHSLDGIRATGSVLADFLAALKSAIAKI